MLAKIISLSLLLLVEMLMAVSLLVAFAVFDRKSDLEEILCLTPEFCMRVLKLTF